jgi:hypothetical protein
MKTILNIYLATFYKEPSSDAMSDMECVKLIKAKTAKDANKQAKAIFKSNTEFKSYGVEKQESGVGRRNCHCAVDNRDQYMTFTKAVDWFNEQVKNGEQNIRVWFIVRDEDELVLYKGNLPY